MSSDSQTDYVCFDFLPRHHNVIRYRRGRELIRNEFHTVCAWKQFEGSDGVNQVGADGSWLYNILVGECSAGQTFGGCVDMKLLAPSRCVTVFVRTLQTDVLDGLMWFDRWRLACFRSVDVG